MLRLVGLIFAFCKIFSYVYIQILLELEVYILKLKYFVINLVPS